MATSAQPGARPAGSPGHFVVLAMLAVAIMAASFAWWWNYQRGRRALGFYGPEAASLIRAAPKVELSFHGEPTRDISKAKGLLNARTSLLGDASYEWIGDGQLDKSDAVLRFTGNGSVSIFFDFDGQTVQMSCSSKIAKLTKKTADGWRSYLDRLGPEGRQEVAPTVRSANDGAANP